MHSLALYSQVPASRRDQILNILAGVTASQPVPIHEQHLVYLQLQLANNPISKKAPMKQSAQNQRPLYHKLIREIHAGDGPVHWRLLVEDIPEPGIKDVISRTATEALMNENDLARFRRGSTLYKYACFHPLNPTVCHHSNIKQICQPIPHDRPPGYPLQHHHPHCARLACPGRYGRAGSIGRPGSDTLGLQTAGPVRHASC